MSLVSPGGGQCRVNANFHQRPPTPTRAPYSSNICWWEDAVVYISTKFRTLRGYLWHRKRGPSEPTIIQALVFPTSGPSFPLLLSCLELLSLGSPRLGRGTAYLAPILAIDMKLLPVHLRNIVTEGSHPLRFSAGDWTGPWPTLSFTSLCLLYKTDSADFLQSQVMELVTMSSHSIKKARATAPSPRQIFHLHFSPFFSLFKCLVFFYFKETHRHTDIQAFSRKTGFSKQLARNTPPVHFPI